MRTPQCIAILFFFGVVTATGACGLSAVGQATGTDSVDASVDGSESELLPPKPGDDETTTVEDVNTPDANTPDTGGVDAGVEYPWPYNTRITDGLVVLYDFEEGNGTTLHDRTVDPCNLTIPDEANVTWQSHALAIDESTIIQSGFSLTKITNACKQTNEISIEAWVDSETTSESDHASIVTMADSNSVTQNFALGTSTSMYRCGIAYTKKCYNYNWWASIQPGNDLNAGNITTDATPTHLVATRTSDGTLSLYVNGDLAGTQKNTANLADWESYPLVIGSVPQGGQGWLGTLHLVAIYGRALSADEIMRNFNAGADPLP
ncbi:MAG: LamG domain-containing protein [Polyangiaceae bacterium]|nr:LamG domain-containing protein [Polyangiaceae bacterium]